VRVKRWSPYVVVIKLLGLWCVSAAGATSMVALDVGHSLAHPGAISARGHTEFSFNRDLTLVVQRVFQVRGLSTQLIGIQGIMSDLRPHTDAASGAAFFLSFEVTAGGDNAALRSLYSQACYVTAKLCLELSSHRQSIQLCY
jgi:hypothetical protein